MALKGARSPTQKVEEQRHHCEDKQDVDQETRSVKYKEATEP